MGSHGAPKRVRHIAGELPDDLVHKIFSQLDFKSKVIAGQVCRRWDQLLKVVIVGARHWAVDYNFDSTVSCQALATTEQVPIVEQFDATIGRWLINRAAAIKAVHVSATLSSDQKGVATINVLENQLPLLAGCLAKYANRLELTFHGGSPFASPLLSSSAFLMFLCPMLKRLSLGDLRGPVTVSQFAAICELSSLEELSIQANFLGGQQAGLQELTSDISKLVNLMTLELRGNLFQHYIPESISCLQKLKVMYIDGGQIEEVPSGLARLTNLSSLVINGHGEPMRLPPSLQDLKSLTSVSLGSCDFKTIPEVLADLSSLTYLDLSENDFESNDGRPWWPTTLSRLTKLAELVIATCEIISLPPDISGLRQLTKLVADDNELRSLPEQLSSLQNLSDLRVHGNLFSMVPVSVLSSCTALTLIDLSYQRMKGIEAFRISSSFLPILHPGLDELDLRQYERWDPLSLCHLARAMAEVADRTPIPSLYFLTEGWEVWKSKPSF